MKTNILNETKFAINTMDKYIHSFISIQGSIGAGKSTLLKSIREWITENNMDATSFSRVENDSNERSEKDGNQAREVVVLNDNPSSENVDQRETFSKFLFIVIDEPVDIWTQKIYDISYDKEIANKSALELFYNDKSRFGFWFQVIAFTSRLRAIVNALEQVDFTSIDLELYNICIIAERSLRSDRLFFHNLYESGWITQAELKVYDDFFDLICGHVLQKEDVMIYLNTSPEKCDERITKRARKSEIGRVNDRADCGFRRYDKLLWILFYVIVVGAIFPSMIPYTIIVGMILAYSTLFENKTNKISLEYLNGIHKAHKEMINDFDGRIIELDFNNNLSYYSIKEITHSIMMQIIIDS